ncbi:fungal specific transcription factor domain-containing protein [Aspergillus stella-maris]|uniref:fungal specific transcription factor domain-containing protein n=1 Tax=Aspergillus stella-maris TaxID=1810926 RepID=UPI003CCD5C4F
MLQIYAKVDDRIGSEANIEVRDLGNAPSGKDSDQRTSQHVNPVEDVVSDLCEGKLSAADEVNNLLDFHQRAFRNHSGEDLPGSKENNLPTPESMPGTNTTGPETKEKLPNLSMPEAESLLAIFRQTERQQYFPFITLSSSVTASQMTKLQPFLLLAILTVCSSRNPHLQARTNERFRRVLSERVILNGEKGLDYLRGLLVYIAWCPMHLRPLQNVNQVTKYIRIAVDMALDLGLDKRFEERTEEEKITYLGTCFLSSFVHGQLSTRPYEARTKIDLPLPVDLNDCGSRKTAIHHLRLQELVGRIAGYNHGLCVPAESFPTPTLEGNCTVEEKMNEFTEELEDFLSVLSDDMRSSAPTLLTTQFIRLCIAYIPPKPLLKRQRALNSTPTPSPCQHSTSSVYSINLLSHATATFVEMKTFLDTFLSLPSSAYTHFSIRVRSQLILTLITSSGLCFSTPSYLHPSAQSTDNRNPGLDTWRKFQKDARARMVTYLESLTDKMRTISASFSPTNSRNSSKANTKAVPDIFSMMSSVLGILTKNYNLPTSPPTFRRTPTSAGCPGSEQRPSSRCPVLNGSIRDTEFWKTLGQLENAPVKITGEHGDRDREAPCADPTKGLNIDDLVNHPQDWPSVFGEWVVDLNFLPA